MTTIAPTAPSAAPIQIGRVVRLTFDTLGQNLWAYVALAAIFGAAPTMTGDWLSDLMARSADAASSPLGAFRGSSSLGGVERIIAYPMIAAITFGVLAQLDGRKASYSECLAKGFKVWGGMFVLNLVIGLGEGLGFLLLIVPGVILTVMWSVAVPVKIAEDADLSKSISRSNALTKGRRWPIAGLVLTYAVAYIALLLLFGAISQALTTIGLGIMGNVLTGLLEIPTSLISAAGLACLYYELRRTREGGGPEAVAEVFA